jgi:hypothetical protein
MKKTIKIPIYHGELIIHQVKGWNKLEKKYGFKNEIEYGATVFKSHHSTGYTRYNIAFLKNPSPATIAHEALHVVSAIFEDRNMIMHTGDYYNEPQSYLLGWVVKQCYKHLKLK